jgi:GTP-binding protein
VADYPFTTMHPNLGVVGIDNSEFVVADIPGLIEGASEGRGLGDLFLGHVERCAVLLHLVDGTAEDVAHDYNVIIGEISNYTEELGDKPRITVLNKIDSLTEDEITEKTAALEKASGGRVYTMSGVSRDGVDTVLRALKAEISMDRLRAKKADGGDEEETSWRP